MSRIEPFVSHEGDAALERWEGEAARYLHWRTLLSADRTPTEALTLGVAELAPGEAKGFRPHRHAPHEAYYVLSGEGVVVLDGEEHPVRAGSVVFVPGGTSHGACNRGSEPLRILYVFAVDSFTDVKYEFPAT